MNSFGRLFRLTIFGESHGPGTGIVVDGCPAGIPLAEESFTNDLARRKGSGQGTTPRKEEDIPEILSGVFNGYTTGAPLTIFARNKNIRPSDYEALKDIPRPGHADFVSIRKYGGFADWRGGGHFSGRITTSLVTAGVIAKKIISPVRCEAVLAEAGGITDIESAVKKAIEEGDSIGGIVKCRIGDVPAGLGEPFFDSVESVLSHIIFAVPAIKGIEFGSGFKASGMKGSDHNDKLISKEGKTETNYSGGINGGITNSNDIEFRVAVKPASSIQKEQRTMNIRTGKMVDLKIEGRHDTCIALRVPVVIEAAAAIVIADFLMLEQKKARINER